MDIGQTIGNFWNNLPEGVKNVVAYAASGFLIGFSMTIVATPIEQLRIDFANAIYIGCVAGFYRMLTEVLSHLTPAKMSTKAGGKNVVATKTFASRML